METGHNICRMFRPFPPLQDPGNVIFAAAATVHLPSFWQDKPLTWFNVCESAFALRQIMSPVTKYHHVIGLILSDLVESIEDVINNYTAYVDPYEELKLRLCRAYGKTAEQKVNDLLDLPPLGAQKPSVLMDSILSL